MSMTFRVKGLAPDNFIDIYDKTDAELSLLGVTRHRVDAFPGYPDRVTMQDMAIGETALLLNYEHLAVNSPYRSRHAIFVKEGALTAHDFVGIVPDVLKRRVISLRAIDENGYIIDAELAEGQKIEHTIIKLFANPETDYIHAHYATRGCFAGLIERD